MHTHNMNNYKTQEIDKNRQKNSIRALSEIYMLTSMV